MLLSLIIASHLALAPPPADAEFIEQLVGCEELQKCPASAALLKRGKKAGPAIIRALSHKKELVRFWACGLLSEIKPKGALEALAGALKDPKIRVRAGALFALGSLGDKRATPHLLIGLKDRDVNLRIASAIGLGTLVDPASADGLVAALRDKDDEVRTYAMLALGDMGHKAALAEIILRLIEDVKPRVRAMACATLAHLGAAGPAAASMIQALEKDLATEVQVECAHGLGSLKLSASVPALKKAAQRPEPVRSAALRALQQIKRSAIK